MHILPPLHRLSRRASTPTALPLLGARDAARTLVPTSGSRCPTLVYSARRSQVCCALLPVLGFISFPAVRTRTAALTAGLSTALRARAPQEPWHIAAFPAMLLPSEELPSMSAVPRLRGPSLRAVHPPTLAPDADRSVSASVPAAPERGRPHRCGASCGVRHLAAASWAFGPRPVQDALTTLRCSRSGRWPRIAPVLPASQPRGWDSRPPGRFGFDFEVFLVHRVRCVAGPLPAAVHPVHSMGFTPPITNCRFMPLPARPLSRPVALRLP